MSEHVQLLLYTSYLHIIGGIETFIINFIDLMSDSYSIGVYCPRLPDDMKNIIKSKAKLYQSGRVDCETLIMVRMMDVKPVNVSYERAVRMCHACRSDKSWIIKQDCDQIVHVSAASKRSFESDGDVIFNPLLKTDKRSLLLVSATRIPALDKGKNADRMLKLARMLSEARISFLWLNFSDAPLKNAPKGFVNVGTFHDLQPYIARADYLVQLSDQEGFGYSVLEALINNTAVICTPFETTKELGVVDGESGYIVPFDMRFDVTKLLSVPQFEYTYHNDTIKAKWIELLSTPMKKQKRQQAYNVRVLVPYKDLELDRYMKRGEKLSMREERARYLEDKKLVKIE